MKLKIYFLAIAMVLTLASCSTTHKNEYGIVDSEKAADKMNKKTQEEIEEVEVSDRVYFNFDQYSLTKKAIKVLSLQAEFLKQETATTITIEGHCDERGTREYNLALGERRASAVKKYLVKNGVSNKRVDTISYGKEKPEFLGKGEKVWSKNRRTVTVINE